MAYQEKERDALPDGGDYPVRAEMPVKWMNEHHTLVIGIFIAICLLFVGIFASCSIIT